MPVAALDKGEHAHNSTTQGCDMPTAVLCKGEHSHSNTMWGQPSPQHHYARKAGPQTHFTRVSMHYAKASMVAIGGGGGGRRGCASYAWTSVILKECDVYFTKICSLQTYSRWLAAYNQACDVETINRRDNHLSFHDCTLIHTYIMHLNRYDLPRLLHLRFSWELCLLMW